jgi:hypothetical protein
MMPDIKTEMSKVLSAWEQDTQAPQEKPMVATPNGKKLWTVTNNVTRATFDYVQKHGGSTGEKIRTDLKDKGFKPSSISSLLAQFVNQGLVVRDVDGKYYAKVTEYRTLKSTRKHKAEGKRKSKIVTSPRSAGLAALQPLPTPKKKASLTGVNSSVVTAPTWPAPAPLKNPAPYVAMAWDAETVINNIGLKQAHALYKELSTYFGG